MNYLSYICTLHTEIKSFIFSIIIMKYPDRIPFEERINSQLSVAKHYWGIIIEGERYLLDYDNARMEVKDGNELYFPDLVRKSTLIKK